MSTTDTSHADDWPKWIDGRQVILCWGEPDRKHRVFLLKRENGTYGVYSQRFADKGECDYSSAHWEPEYAHRGDSIFDTEETAKREAEAAFPWIADIEPKMRGA